MEYSSGKVPIEDPSGEPEPVSQGMGSRSTRPPFSSSKLFYLEMSLLLLLMPLSSLAAVVLMRIAQQIEVLTNPCTGFLVFQPATIWWHSPGFIYFVSALSFAISYCASSGLSIIWRQRLWPSSVISILNTLYHPLTFVFVAFATGNAYLDVYIGLKGIKYVGWVNMCSVYDEFCTHYDGTSVALSFIFTILLVLLIMPIIKAITDRIANPIQE